MDRIDLPVIDVDQHYYETRDAFVRHMESRYRDRAVEVVRLGEREEIRIAGRRHEYAPTFEVVAPPGSILSLIEGADGRGSASPLLEPLRPEYQNREARLAALDRMGVQSAVLLPTLGVTIEHPLRHDAEGTFANLRAFNRWLDEEWGFARDERLVAVPMLSLVDIDLAVEELERVLALGARMVHLLAGPVAGRSPADPVFDPFWIRVAEAGVPVAYHGADSGYTELLGTIWGETPNVRVHHMSAWQNAFCFIDAPIMHTLGALIFGNLFGRFPGLRVVSIEHGAGWVPYLLDRLDKSQKRVTRHAPWIGGNPADRARDIFRSHVTVSPYPEDDLETLVELIGPGAIAFGSDWPHPEGLADPLSFADRLPSHLSAGDRRRVMHDNAAKLLGFGA
jgi:predicted TIM-barrel fold metal-dependent hydrolase